MNKTGFVRHPLYLKHLIDQYHPESPDRLISIYNMVEQDFNGRLIFLEPREATREELGWIHHSYYIDRVAATEGEYVRLDPDTGTSPDTYRAALLAAGGLLSALDAIYRGEVDNAFAAIRPPGHHAEANRSAGFCLFNNVAIAAEYACRKLGAERILIYDWDLHHGNGTQHSFESSPNVLYVSTHQYPYYPGTGNFNETGYGEGEGYTLNIPLSHGFGSGDFLMLIERIIKPVTLAYKPDLIIISAGYDTYEHDPLGAMSVTTEGYGAMTLAMLELARQCCQGRLLVSLEGGYHIAGLTAGVHNTLQVLVEGRAPEAWLHPEPLRDETTAQLINRLVEIHGGHWPALVHGG